MGCQQGRHRPGRPEAVGPIRQEVSTVAVDTAPDVIVGAHDWVGELSGNGSIIPLSPSAATKKQFPAYALNAFSYGTAIKKLYGAPVALENIALITNTNCEADEIVRGPREAGPRGEEEDEVSGRPRRAAGGG